MTEKVVPESVMPQNIAACLIDENAQIPELDAFTFLNRVRALGIGSADFLYLLKGCDAPEEAIEKIENNPAMNLQGLVVTLESSGLTPKDYTRMLYTARQLWERTLTMQLDEIEQDETPTAEEIVPVSEEQNEDNYEVAEGYSENIDEIAENTEEEFFGDEDLPENGDIEEITEDYDEEYGDPEDDDYAENDRPKIDFGNHNREEEAKTNTGKIVAASIGAVLLLGLSGVMDYMGFEKLDTAKPKAHFAADSQEIFTEIYTAYNSGKLGGEIIARSFDTKEVFGDMLITQPTDGLGVYSVGSKAFSAKHDNITVYQSDSGSLSVLGTIPAPENSEFIEMIQLEDRLCAVFSGDNSAGFITYDENGKAVYSCNQLGELTDINIEKDSISLGTVYVPPFTESFTVEHAEKFTPVIQLDSSNVTIPPESIVTSGSATGCGYAVFAQYSLTDGTLTDSMAALGDPVFSGAEQFSAIMRTQEGFELIALGQTEITEEEQITPILCETLTNALCFDDGTVFATAERSEDGTVSVYLRGEDLSPLSAVTNLPEEFTSLRIADDILYIYGKDSIIMTIDISDPVNPKIMELTSAFGVIRDDYALCCNATSSLVKLTLYKKTVEGTKEAGSYTKTLTLQNNEVPKFGGMNSFYIGNEERCAATYSYFDGVSVISEVGLFGKVKTAYTLFDDKTGFTEAANINGELHLIHGTNSITVK